jgi:hypothetical protein
LYDTAAGLAVANLKVIYERQNAYSLDSGNHHALGDFHSLGSGWTE